MIISPRSGSMGWFMRHILALDLVPIHVCCNSLMDSKWVWRMVQILDAVQRATASTTMLQSRTYSTRVMKSTTYFTKAAENVTVKWLTERQVCNALVENLFVSYEFSGQCESVKYFAVGKYLYESLKYKFSCRTLNLNCLNTFYTL